MDGRPIADFLGTISTGAFDHDYTFLETVGKGGYGEVYKVKSKKDYQTYAVKKIRFDQRRRKNKLHLIKRELINNAKLSHDNVVRYYDSWLEVSRDQSLNRMFSTDSDTEYSKTSEKDTDCSAEINFDCKNLVAKRLSELTIHDAEQNTNIVSDISNNSNVSEHASETDLSDIRTDITSSDDSSCAGVNENKAVGSEREVDSRESDLNSNNATTNVSAPKVLPHFKMLKMSFEEDSAGSEQPDSDSTEIDSDVIFDKDAPQVTRQDKGVRNIDDECEDSYPDGEQGSLSSDAELAEILREISDSVSSDGNLQPSSNLLPNTNSVQNENENSSPRFLDLYIKMEFCEQTLREAIDKGKLFDNDSKGWSYFRQIVRGLNYIHSKGITHRDLNPRNIFITKEDIVKIGDFGLSRLLISEVDSYNGSDLEKQSETSKSGGMTGGVGTIWYTAPEVLSESSCIYGHEVDLFSLGLIFFEMCHDPISTGQEKAMIFENLRKERMFPDSFDIKSKERQEKVIRCLIDPNPKSRVPLAKLMNPSDGFVVPDPSEKLHFKLMLPEVISRPEGELYKSMIQQLFMQRTGKCWTTFHCNDITKHVVKMTQIFISVAKSHGAIDINLPLFMPLEDFDTSDPLKTQDQAVFLDPHGNPISISDSSLRAFCFQLQRNDTIPPCNTFYNTQSSYKLISLIQKPVNHPQVSYFSFSAKDDLLAIGKALLILQQSLTRTGHSADDFVICLAHKDLEEGLAQAYDLGETERRILYKLNELFGDTTRRIKFLKQLSQFKLPEVIAIPEVLASTLSIKKMSEKLDNILGSVHRSIHGFDEQLSNSIRKTFDFVKDLKTILEKIGISMELKIELFMKNPKVDAIESGIKFRLRSKQKLYVVSQGGQYEIDVKSANAIGKRDFFWYELNTFLLEETDIIQEGPDVLILYDKTQFEEVKSTAYLCGKLTNIGFSVTEVERMADIERKIHISPYCKFLVRLDGQTAVLQYEEESKLKNIPMKKIQTVVNHVKQRRNTPCRKWFLAGE